jgi:hypothetical protein
MNKIFFTILPGDKESKHFDLRLKAVRMMRDGYSPRTIRRTLKISHRQMKKAISRCAAYSDVELPSAAYYLAETAFMNKTLAEPYKETL